MGRQTAKSPRSSSPGHALLEGEERPEAVVATLLKSPRGVEVLLEHGAGIFAEERNQPTVIVMQSTFDEPRRHAKLGAWLRLLRERDFTQLEAELEAEFDAGLPERPEAA